MFIHTDLFAFFTHIHFYTRTLLHTDVLCTQMFLHTDAVANDPFYTQTPFLQKRFQSFSQAYAGLRYSGLRSWQLRTIFSKNQVLKLKISCTLLKVWLWTHCCCVYWAHLSFRPVSTKTLTHFQHIWNFFTSTLLLRVGQFLVAWALSP